ncbi:cyclic nucleotide-binding domain-containing protein [Myxococcus sp. RHSTA-1-4]|uniref:cyclic nucleotide-binding domain-containing protein n=1 Tax=Myxococcus sp. RHSTA-1-4 TaxID=2874601 RepID=UPI001CBBFBDA|nr:cyclic nucleotide-binding domain-containing protein [Myxococcus sp. RHSTA-1-4]MBZ4422896.1 cyclic nucleotide-binding domain-containing protein [Myxococcus sp. RHSTA-1-4]
MPGKNASASLDSPSPASAREAPATAVLREARNRGTDMLVAGDLEAALTAFQEAVKVAPEEPSCRQKVAEVLQRLGRTRGAIAEYEAAARAWEKLGWTLRAIALCKVILQLDPDHGRAHALLVELRARRGLPLPGAAAGKSAAAPPVTPPAEAPVKARSADVVAHLVRSSPLFSRLRRPLLQTVRDAFTPCTVDAGEQVLTRGQPAQALYLLLRGRCTVFHQHVDGHETPYPDLVEGDVFGEVSLLRSKLVTASVRAATPCLLLKLERSAFEQLLDAEPELRRELQRMGAERLWRTTRLLTGRPPEAAHEGEPHRPG